MLAPRMNQDRVRVTPTVEPCPAVKDRWLNSDRLSGKLVLKLSQLRVIPRVEPEAAVCKDKVEPGPSSSWAQGFTVAGCQTYT